MPPDAAPSLRLRGVEQRFAGLDTPALAIAALDIDAGEQIAVTGPSGSGKTTLINILTGLERAGQGSVAWGGTDLARLTEGARDRWRAANIGLVMQDFHLFTGLSALDNVLLPQRLGRLRLPAGAQTEALRLLARVGIERPGQSVETMSRGQMQRVAVARALAAKPSIIVADEPTASLDAESGAAVAAMLVELASESGATLLVATHDAPLVARLRRVLRLESGRLKD